MKSLSFFFLSLLFAGLGIFGSVGTAPTGLPAAPITVEMVAGSVYG